MPTVTQQHMDRAARWLLERPGIVRPSALASLLIEVEAPLQARCAALEAALHNLHRCTLAWANQPHTATDTINWSRAMNEAEKALSGSDSALKAMLVRAASDALHDGCESASEYACSSEPERDRWAEAIAERVRRGE